MEFVSWDDDSIPFSEWKVIQNSLKFHGSSHHQPVISLMNNIVRSTDDYRFTRLVLIYSLKHLKTQLSVAPPWSQL